MPKKSYLIPCALIRVLATIRDTRVVIELLSLKKKVICIANFPIFLHYVAYVDMCACYQTIDFSIVKIL